MTRTPLRTSRMANLVLLTVSMAGGLLLAEAGIRLAGLAPGLRVIRLEGGDTVYRRSENPLLSYELKPGYRNDKANLRRSYPRTNAHGTLGAETFTPGSSRFR